MKSYSILDKDISKYRSGKNKNEDVFLLGIIKAFCSNYRSGESHVTQEKLKTLTGLPLRTIQSIISRLRETNLITVETLQIGKQKLNVYRFNLRPANFFLVKNSFYYTNIDQKGKGFLLLIKSLCINNTNTTLYNRTQIAKELGQDRNTVSKMINNLVEKNMLLELDQGFSLPANYFPLYSKDKTSKFGYEKLRSEDKFVLNTILDFCNEKGSILFAPDLKPLKIIFAYYPFQKRNFENLNDEDFIKSHYLPEVLKTRCATLPPKIESLNYFLTVLNVEYVEQSKEHSPQIIL